MNNLAGYLTNPWFALIIGGIVGYVLAKIAKLVIVAVIGILLLSYLGVSIIDPNLIPNALAYAAPLLERLKNFILQSQALAVGTLLGFALGFAN